MRPNTILWTYIVLLVAGGMIGLLKAGSKASFFTSLGFAAGLILCAMNIITGAHTADYILIGLLFVFGARFAKSRKFMPMGLMGIVTILALAARNWP
jgi:uncharacterized membrane protein (UPF0136 family)